MQSVMKNSRGCGILQGFFHIVQALEKEGLVRSVAGKGFYVCEYNADYLKEKQLVLLEKRLNEVIEEAKQAGLAKEDFVEMVQALYEQ